MYHDAGFVDAAGNRWLLYYFLDGDGADNAGHVSLYLSVRDAATLPFGWQKHATCVAPPSYAPTLVPTAALPPPCYWLMRRNFRFQLQHELEGDTRICLDSLRRQQLLNYALWLWESGSVFSRSRSLLTLIASKYLWKKFHPHRRRGESSVLGKVIKLPIVGLSCVVKLKPPE